MKKISSKKSRYFSITLVIILLIPFLALTSCGYILNWPAPVYETNDIADYGIVTGNYNNDKPQEFVSSFFPEKIEEYFSEATYHYKAIKGDTYAYEMYLEFVIQDAEKYDSFLSAAIGDRVCEPFHFAPAYQACYISNYISIQESEDERPPYIGDAKIGLVLFSKKEQRIIFVALGMHDGGGADVEELGYFFDRFDIDPWEYEERSTPYPDPGAYEYLTEESADNLISVEIPVVDTPNAPAVNDCIKKQVYREVRRWLTLEDCNVKESQTPVANIRDRMDPSEYAVQYLHVSYRLSFESAQRISFVFTGEYNAKTAAHPNAVFFTINVDIPTAQLVGVADVYAVDDSLYDAFLTHVDSQRMSREELLSAKVFNKDDFLQGLAREPENQFYSYFTPDGVGISYPVPYAIGSHVEAEIPYEKVTEK